MVCSCMSCENHCILLLPIYIVMGMSMCMCLVIVVHVWYRFIYIHSCVFSYMGQSAYKIIHVYLYICITL